MFVPKTLIKWTGILSVLALLLLFSAYLIRTSSAGYDLTLRYNECRLMLEEHLDPADVVAGRAESQGFRFFMDSRPEQKGKAVIHAYPPWEYGLMLPLATQSKSFVGWIYRIVNTFALGAIFAFSIWYMRRADIKERSWDLIAPLGLLIFIVPLRQCAALGNFGLLMTATYIGAAWALTTRRPIVLGLFWALAMIKPQLGIWLAFPIFFTRQWKAIPVAVGLCCALTLVPALYLWKSPIALILELSDTSAQSAAVTHYGAGLFAFLHYTTFQPFIAPLNMIVCAIVVGIFSWRFRHCRDGLFLLAPIALCALWGSYSQPHDRMLLFLPCLLLIREGIRIDTPMKQRLASAFGIFLIAGMSMVHLRLFRGIFSPWAVDRFLSKVFVVADPCFWVLLTLVLIRIFTTLSTGKKEPYSEKGGV